ncbi:MAG: hypothetical protein CMG57_00770 [Candidatus Marinimicrobia bacterium]|nr:hypothetical protein [Candidatus Neomarinimicrobiota bacterium]
MPTEMIKIFKNLILIVFWFSVLSAQDISIFFLNDGSIVQGKVVNENQHRIFVKTDQGTIKILPKDIIGREDLAKKGDLTFMTDRVDYLHKNIDRLTGQLNYMNDSLNMALEDLYDLVKNLEVLQNEFEIDLLRLHSQGREQKNQIKYVQNDLVNQRVDIAVNRQEMGGIDDTVTTLNKQLSLAKKKLEATANQSYLISGTISNINHDISELKLGQQNQQNQIDIMAGSLANIIQEVQAVRESFGEIKSGIQNNQEKLSQVNEQLNIKTDELGTLIINSQNDFNQQMEVFRNSFEDSENQAMKERKKIIADMDDYSDELMKMKKTIDNLENDITTLNVLEKKIKSLEASITTDN